MTKRELYELNFRWLVENHDYSMQFFQDFDYSILNRVLNTGRQGRGKQGTVNDVIIMADTETSKKSVNTTYTLIHKDGRTETKYNNVQNHVVAWTISIRAYGMNIVTLYGQKPSDMIDTFVKIQDSMKGDDTIIYFHNLAYDWQFLRKFLFDKYLIPVKQLNTKAHYPIHIEFANGLILRDSLILSQRSLDKWAKDLDVTHKKAKGSWDYDIIRNQRTKLSPEELHYIENDTLAGVECIQKTMDHLNKKIHTMPFTATGIPREQVRLLAKENHFKGNFTRMALTYLQHKKAELIYHGGYTHGNRHLIGWIIRELVKCYDFASSYPFCMIAFKYPMTNFVPIEITKDEILEFMDDYAYMFRLTLVRPRLKNDSVPMPALQESKCVKTINSICDNGRILCAAYASIYLTEYDLAVINEQYDADEWIITEAEQASKDYLPRWFTDYVFKCFEEKTMLKGGDPVAYAIAKARLNSLYGMCVQNPLKPNIAEKYSTGEYMRGQLNDETGQYELEDEEELYNKYLKRRTSILPYQWGVWVTAIAFWNLHRLGKCMTNPTEDWVYSDTDSCYATNWDEELIIVYNEDCKRRLKLNNYGPVVFRGREYWLGIAEHEELKDDYTEFRVMGAKRYCGRNVADGEVHITVAGVPKKGAKCLNDDIANFSEGFVFDGATTGKKTHTYIYVEKIYEDENGNETGDSIDLTLCDYRLDTVEKYDWESMFATDEYIPTYEEEDLYEL